MKIALIIIVVLAWLISGHKSFVYWWTKDYDLTTRELALSIFISIVGPFAYLAGRGIHGDKGTKVLKKKREE